MSNVTPLRPATPSIQAVRPVRPPVPELPGFEVLDQAHRAALEMLQAFDRLVVQLNDQGLDDPARASAAEILAFFNGPGRDHHAQEDRLVFPELLVGGDATLIQHVHRLQQDHGWIEEDWRLLAPQFEAIARGYEWFDLPMLNAALPIFTALYRDHIALEESLIYPEAKRHLKTRQQAEHDRTEGS
jgi:hemerythrin-like domain-containing protein